MADQAASLSPTLVSPLVGREREQSLLRTALTAALAGHGSLVLIGGEAGIGKTALAEVLCHEAAQQGAFVLVGRCYDLTDTSPYGPWVDLFLRLPSSPDLPAFPPAFAARGTVGTVASQMALFLQVHDFLAAIRAQRPLVLLLDDIHWADPASLDLLRFLARAPGDLGLLLVATYRAEELTRHHPLAILLPVFVREARATRLDVHPLPQAAIAALVHQRYPLGETDTATLSAYLDARTEGNPFFIGEVLRTLEEDAALLVTPDGWCLGDLARTGVPPLLRQVIEGRLGRLDAETQRLLAVAAVIGQVVPVDLWVAVAAVDENAILGTIDRALEAHLLAEASDGGGARFGHALVRETLYAGMSATRRRPIHRRVGEALAARPHPDADVVASHFQRAGEARAITWLVRAGERAQLAYAWLTAIGRYEAALALLESNGGDLAERGWLRYRSARLRRVGTPRKALEHLDEALRIATLVEDRALAAAARYTRGLCLFFTAAYDDAIRELGAGADALEALPLEEQERLDLGPDAEGLPTATNPRGMLVVVLAELGRVAEAVSMGEETHEGRPRHTPLGELGWAHHGDRDTGLGIAHALAGHPDAARAAFARARAIFRAGDNPDYLGSSATLELLLLALPCGAERPEQQDQLVAEVAEAGRRGSATAEGRVHVARLPLLALRGRWPEALAEADAAMREGSRGSWQVYVSPILGEIARLRGEPEAAWPYIRALLLHGPQTAPGTLLLWGGLALIRLAAALALDAVALPQAHAWLLAHDRWLAWSGAVLGQSEGHTLWAAYHRATGDTARAREYAARALAHASEPRQPLALLAAHRLLGELDTAAGQHDAASRHLAAALHLAETCAAPHERALALLALAELRSATGERGAARSRLDEVLGICVPLGARPVLARAAALAQRLEATITAPLLYPAGLSAREAEVLRLVAAGLSNPQVGQRLFLSPRTVEQHLRSIFNKVGVPSRAAAARWAAEQGLA